MRFGLCRILLALSIASVCASAAPVLWTLAGVTFGDGGTASGTFVYDATGNVFSAINISTTTGSARTGATYHFVSNGFPPGAGGVLVVTSAAVNQMGSPAFALFFTPNLSNSGGTVSLTGQEANCGDPGCVVPSPPARFVTAGSAVGTPTGPPPPGTPAPPTLVLTLMGIGAAGIYEMRRRFSNSRRTSI
jgi:hypothetical protein